MWLGGITLDQHCGAAGCYGTVFPVLPNVFTVVGESVMMKNELGRAQTQILH